MLSSVESIVLNGLEAIPITVEVDVSNGLPSFDLVGLPNAAVREARERVRAAVKNSGFDFPLKRITVNLAPADIRKEGAVLDLAIALGILGATGQVPENTIKNTVVLGELSLDGKVRPVNGVLPAAMSLRILQKKGMARKLIVPQENYSEAALVQGLSSVPVDSLTDAVECLKGNKFQPEIEKNDREDPGDDFCPEYDVDFSEVKGQHMAKRALEIAAAGGHNILMIGSPGSGKTMLARRLTTITPPMSLEEALEVTRIYSVAGMLPKGDPLIRKRPFRAPHHTASAYSIIGGGRIPKPGELSLAHNGILFLDEFPEFKRDVLEALRQPLEEGTVRITRVNAAVTYPANIMLVAAMNPCPCGFLGDSQKECLCTPTQVARYRSRLSGPLLDRIDMHIDVPRLEIGDLMTAGPEEHSSDIRKRVAGARLVQLERLKLSKVYTNAGMTQKEIKKFCETTRDAQALLKASFSQLNLSARSYGRVLKVARTIADLAGNEKIDSVHIAEALQFRSMDQRYWQ